MSYIKQIERARREAARLRLVLENRFAASSCEGVYATGATLVYTHAGRVYHLVVHDMGEAKAQAQPQEGKEP